MLERAVAEAFALRLAGRAQILRELDRVGPRPGTRALCAGCSRRRAEAHPLAAGAEAACASSAPPAFPNRRPTCGSGAGRSTSSGGKPGSCSRSTPTRPTPRRGRSSAIAARAPSCEDLGLSVHRVTRNQLDLDPPPTIARIRRRSRLPTRTTPASRDWTEPRAAGRPALSILDRDGRTSDIPGQARPRRDAQGRRDHGRGHGRGGPDRRGGGRRRGDGARARPRRHPPRRRRRADERPVDDRGDQGRRSRSR